MAVSKYVILAVILAGVCDAAWKHKRSPQEAGKKGTEPEWQPVNTPQEFTVMVDDNIKQADQFRHETWKPGGIIEGEYAAPARDGKWLKVNYRADKEGFHIISQKVVDQSELNQPSGGAAADHQATVETHVNGKDTKYTVKEDDLKKAKNQKPTTTTTTDQQHSGL